MSIKIVYKNLWTYNVKIPPKDRKASEKKLPIAYLNGKEYSHIHGNLQIIINDRIVPGMGIDSPDDVCFGYWIEMFTKLFAVFKSGKLVYTIEGGEQGKPAYRFDKEENNIYLSIVDSMLGGRGDPNWQRVEFKLSDFEYAFKNFKKLFLENINLYAPNMFEEWRSKFQLR